MRRSAGEIVKALVTRAAERRLARGASLDPRIPPIARALGRCAFGHQSRKDARRLAVRTAARAAYAGVALGDVASKKKALAASDAGRSPDRSRPGISTPALIEALHPFVASRHPPRGQPTGCSSRQRPPFDQAGGSSPFARLSRAGKGAASELDRVLSHTDVFHAAEERSGTWARPGSGDVGQRALAEALASIVPARDPLALTALGTSAFGPLLVALQTLSKPDLPG